MDTEDRESDGGVAREARFVNLIQPNKDMAANWSVDVGNQLEGYLEELRATGLFDGDDSPLNFAEAALLIQGSIQVYSRKVEYLYNLVLRALDFVSEKRQGQEGGKSPLGKAEQDCRRTHEEEEDFLKSGDDISEEGDIDVVDDEEGSSLRPLKVPASLLVTDVEGSDMSGDAGELASYNVATCTLFRGFLLLDPVDTATVDRYLTEQEPGLEECREANGSVPVESPRRNSNRPENLGTCYGSEEGAANVENIFPSTGGANGGAVDGADPSWHGDGDDGMAWEGHAVEDDAPDIPQDRAFEGGRKPGDVEGPQDDYKDPWEPLNPHEEGTMPVKSFKKGPTQRVLKSRMDQSFPQFSARRDRLFYPEFAKALQIRQAREKKETLGEDHMRKPCQSPDDVPGNDECGPLSGEGTWEDLGDYDNDEMPETGKFEAGDLGDDGTAEPSNLFNTSERYGGPLIDNVSHPFDDSPGLGQGTDGDNATLEDLCRAHVDSVLQKLVESRTRSGLTSRVTTWKTKIEVALKEDESRPPFDIHEVGDGLLQALSTSVAPTRNDDGEEEIDESFASLVNGQTKDGVARAFSALLQLVNNGDVSIDRRQVDNGSQCFTSESPFRVKLLNAEGRHGGQFAHMTARANLGPLSSRGKSFRSQAKERHPNMSQRSATTRGVRLGRPSPSVSHSCGTPSSGVRIRGFARILASPSSTGRSRKRGQSVAGRHGGGVPDVENKGVVTPEKGYTLEKNYTPVKLTPNRRQSKRKPLQAVQVQ